MQIKDIRPLRSDKYKIAVIDHQKGYFVLVRLSDGQQSPIYNDNMCSYAHVMAYEDFRDSHKCGYDEFNGLCDREAATWEH